MHRNNIIQQLLSYEVTWKNESSMVKRLIDFILSNTECFERHLKKGHVTGSAWVVNKGGTHVLLTHHKKLNKWLQLGGHADGDSDILRVALREVYEESGLEQAEALSGGIFDIDIHQIPRRGEEPGHYHYDIRYAIQATGSETYIVSDESHDLSWIDIRKLEQKTNDESILRMASKWIAGRKDLSLGEGDV
ncbi:MAG TPA: NUDIX domain-containing protein [Nitrospiria bacterium]|nr:NUDIX domain-containing protein [Candidatus Manganitrophaceae bacterium]HIL34304.1 NUDIX domain-containing protein [Candidatus Manganitrophaceae bacterium]